ncbi:bifunctional 2-aminoadipate transaminase/aromatic-amino-acid:2-oxoglutarate transaminase [Sugiyamaella lignohabitans]|uniref:aromatic-amino-acid transaminase n=1 Tax=Sugiyamaella lignohabitans TaxID=796027 RepID=A0A167DEA0_9ASCO|nr:bifunctional 2-aminoadipate transaminase/aromatic-amino-acid:2-oxoglutarate transaminase [Sugiyamaella lignohabitans]ANB12816.1 bifunctional 2-aminoadipate transaminase/aromatic-amino-acid:2-oxoglutarate transaminase [Sugiyamaella lignohabitans]
MTATDASSKPLAQDLRHHFSEEAKGRNPSALKEAFKHFHDPKIISLGGGLPVPTMFPFDNLSIESPAPPFAKGNDAAPTSAEETTNVHVTKAVTGKYDDIFLNTALQYGHSNGAPQLLDFITKHTEIVHDVAYKNWQVILTVGNTQGWDSTLRTFTNRGDTILAEQFTFSSAAECVHGLGVNIVPVKMDLNGIDPVQLDKQLDEWVGPKPKLLYTIPTGQNPTGSTLSRERREAIYKIAQKHDFLIVEDEPYYFLQMPEYTKDPEQRKKDYEHISHEDFLKTLVSSYLEVDTDGRVIRLDSFSKVIAPGTRIGWIVAQEAFVERYLRLHEVSIQVASGFSQAIVNGLLQRWGQEGYLDWLIGLRKAYSHKRDVAVDAIEKYVPKEVIDFIAPDAGMFFWIKLDARKHPKYAEFNNDAVAIENYLYEEGLKFGVQLVPGHWFLVNDKTNPPQKELAETVDEKNAIYFRGTFASVPADKLEKALELFGAHIAQQFGVAK